MDFPLKPTLWRVQRDVALSSDGSKCTFTGKVESGDLQIFMYYTVEKSYSSIL